MRKTIIALAFASLLAMPASAAPLNKDEQDFVTLVLASISASNLCGNDVVKGGIGRVADELGVRSEVAPAVAEALNLLMDKDYDRSVLVPEVTRQVRTSLEMLLVVTKDKINFCRKTVPALVTRGILEKK